MNSSKYISNQKIARMFEKIAGLLKLKPDQDSSDPFRIRAYENAAESVKNYPNSIQDEYFKGKLDKIPGLGDDTFQKVQDYLENQTVQTYEKLKKLVPESLLDLIDIPGIGPKTTRQLYDELDVESIKDLKYIMENSPEKIVGLKGMGEKKLEQIKKGIEMFQFTQKRTPIGVVYPFAEKLINQIKDYKEVKKVKLAGSIRRMKEDIGDLDVLIVSNDSDKTVNKLTKLKRIDKIIAQGDTKVSIFVKDYNIQVDFRLIDKDSWGSAICYFTGSKQHNINLRTKAKSQGIKVSEYGIYKNEKKIGGENEKDIYNILDMQYVPPELRENRGEIPKAEKNKLPELIQYDDLRGDLHVHSNYSDGVMELEQIVQIALNLGYEYIGFTDHSQALAVAGGLDLEAFENKSKKLKKLRKKYNNKIKLLIGTECDILSDGSLDYDENILEKCNYVIGSIHMKLKGDQTERYLKALDSPYLDIIGHPTGRLIGNRREMEVNWEKVFKKAIDKGVVMELNAQAKRLDIKDKYVKKFISMGGKIIINTDAHVSRDLKENPKFGIGQARRGWARRQDVINTYSYDKLMSLLNK